MKNELELIGKKWSQPNQATIPAVVLRDCGKLKIFSQNQTKYIINL
jgi:hypothetical protein